MKMYFVPLDPEVMPDLPEEGFLVQIMTAALRGLEEEGRITSSQQHLVLEYLSKDRDIK